MDDGKHGRVVAYGLESTIIRRRGHNLDDSSHDDDDSHDIKKNSRQTSQHGTVHTGIHT